jgi:hypothetical protein
MCKKVPSHFSKEIINQNISNVTILDNKMQCKRVKYFLSRKLKTTH